MTELNKARGYIRPIAGIVGIFFAACALLKPFIAIRMATSVTELALVAIALLVI